MTVAEFRFRVRNKLPKAGYHEAGYIRCKFGSAFGAGAGAFAGDVSAVAIDGADGMERSFRNVTIDSGGAMVLIERGETFTVDSDSQLPSVWKCAQPLDLG
jgi:hypothetical protein